MSGGIPSDGAFKPRSALGDVTNRVRKRGFSYMSTPGHKSVDEGVQFSKKECLRVDNFKKENFHKEISECVVLPQSCSESNSLNMTIIASISKIPCEIKEPCPPDGGKDTTSALKAGDAVSDSCISTQLIPTSPSDRNSPQVIVEAEKDERTDSVFVPQNESKERVENSLSLDDGDDACLDNLSKNEYLDCSKLPESQESRCGLERCVGQKGDGFSSVSMDFIKACQCSFCMKAAYLWSDLHYQDIKGRIAAIKKSQNEASILVNQNSKDGATGRHGQGNFEKSSNLESDLTSRWMSLFLNMEHTFVREGTQLETSLSMLKELRDYCKDDTEKE